MPSIDSTTLRGKVNFSLPRAEVDNPDQYLVFDVNNLIPSKISTIPVWDLREEMRNGGLSTASAEEQLDRRGFAVVEHKSDASLEKLSTVDGTNAYLEESKELLRKLLGASKVVAWNSVVRANTPESQESVKETQQKKVEKDFAPTDSVKAVAGSAHVDQDETYARTIIKRACGDDVFGRYSRLQIINLWRPLVDVVTNKPLLMGDFSSFAPEDIWEMGGSFGGALTVSHSAGQRWSYIQHQTPQEGILLRCYDSLMGKDGKALYCGHVAGDILDEPTPAGMEGKPQVPRTSVEVRLFVLHE
ncbi:hypothetical protein JCM8547_005120 [Rhodosporidiobolus lusitaniae]